MCELFGCGVNYVKNKKFFIFSISIWTFQVCSSFPVADDEGIQYKAHGIVRLGKNEKFTICKGVVMDVNYFITTDECVKKHTNSLDDLEVVVGTISAENIGSNKNAQTRKVSGIEFPPLWSFSGKTYGDLALMKVTPPFIFNALVAIDYFSLTSAVTVIIPLVATTATSSTTAIPTQTTPLVEETKETEGTVETGVTTATPTQITSLAEQTEATTATPAQAICSTEENEEIEETTTFVAETSN